MITDHQYRRFKLNLKTEKSLAIASEKTGRKYRDQQLLPSQNKVAHTWQTRKDPFSGVWNKIKEMILINPGLEAKTIFNDLKQKNPEQFQDGQLRTLQRKLKYWRATEGPSKNVIFPQNHFSGDLGASDFTHMDKLGITIQGQPFDHLIYHFVLTYSNWETGSICFSESFESFSEGFQNALWELGGSPKNHRTDNFTAAVTCIGSEKKFTSRYKSMLAHYKIEGQTIQSGCPNENGDSEQSHRRFKKAVEQALMLRYSKDFDSRAEYESFLKKIFNQLNLGRGDRFLDELDKIKSLPVSRLDDFITVKTTVHPSSTLRLKNKTYSVPSRLIGEKVKALIYSQVIDIYLGNTKVIQLPRIMSNQTSQINYRHVIDSLLRKPGAFENYKYQPNLFPTSRFRFTYDLFKKHQPTTASKAYLKILHLASQTSETNVDKALELLLATEQLFSLTDVENITDTATTTGNINTGLVSTVNLSEYDELISQDKMEVTCQ